MPIRPENRDRYPPSWREISYRIRSERADWRCECLGECGLDHSEDDDQCGPPHDRCQANAECPHPRTGSKVILTVAHLDHTPENCADENLKAMCQQCHNRYDAAMRRAGIQERERANAAVADLFQQAKREERT